jgi:hypothetical protein
MKALICSESGHQVAVAGDSQHAGATVCRLVPLPDCKVIQEKGVSMKAARANALGATSGKSC